MKVSQFTEQQRSASMPPASRSLVPRLLGTRLSQAAIRHFSKILANNRGPYISIVDVPSHHCALPQLKVLDDTCVRARVVLGGVAMRRRIRKLKYEKFC